MSNLINFTASTIYEAHFGTAPGTQDARVECEKWQRLCDKLLADRKRIQAELEKERVDKLCKNFKPDSTRDEVHAQVDRETTMEQIIAELEQAVGKKT